MDSSFFIFVSVCLSVKIEKIAEEASILVKMGVLRIEKVIIEKPFNQKVISYCYFRLLNKL